MKTSARKLLANAALAAVSISLSLAAAEAAFRIWNGIPIFDPRSFREVQAVHYTVGPVAYDRDLGWVFKPNDVIKFSIPGGFPYRKEPIPYSIGTIEYGIRKNFPDNTTIRTKGILAVGDSFTAGSEVPDHATWPAQLEALTKTPVLNGGVGGYGSDQIVIRAEKLLPVVQPTTLIVGMLDQDVLRAGYSNFSAPKPYYTLNDGALVLNNSPVPILTAKGRNPGFFMRAASHSLIVDQVMRRFFPGAWLPTREHVFTKTGADVVEITCLLLKRLKTQTDSLNIRTLLLMQYGGGFVNTSDTPSDIGIQVGECARRIGYQVVDEFQSLKAIARNNPAELRKYYIMHGDAFGHMSELGNRHIANLVASALQDPKPSERATDYKSEPFTPGDGQNLIPNSEAIEEIFANSNIASLESLPRSTGQPGSYRVAAVGPDSEHYLVSSPLSLPEGPYTFSLDIKADGTSKTRIQLLNTEGNGVIGDFDLNSKSFQATRVGAGRNVKARLREIERGWYRLWLGATLPKGNLQIFLGLKDQNGELGFSPKNEAYQIRALQLEYGQSASDYQPTSGKPLMIQGDGSNLITQSMSWNNFLVASNIASFAQRAERPSEYTVSAIGPRGEHYLVSQPVALEPGVHVLSLDVRPNGTQHLRVQLLDAKPSGVIGDYDLSKRRAKAESVGAAEGAVADITELDDGWYRLKLAVSVQGGENRVLVGLKNASGHTGFAPNGEAFDIRMIDLQRAKPAH